MTVIGAPSQAAWLVPVSFILSCSEPPLEVSTGCVPGGYDTDFVPPPIQAFHASASVPIAFTSNHEASQPGAVDENVKFT